MSSAESEGSGGGKRVGAWITIAALTVGVLGVAMLFSYALTRSRNEPKAPEAPPFSRFEAAWSSAMRKAGVEATFPPEPVDLTALRPSGRRSFEATFTAEEISALLNVYRFETEIEGTRVVLAEAEVGFPSAGKASLDARLRSGGSSYSLRAEAPLTYAISDVRTKGLTSLNVEGFDIRGAKRKQAGEAIMRYVNELIDAAPGLTVGSARIVPDGVAVTGFAPAKLANPPAKPAQ